MCLSTLRIRRRRGDTTPASPTTPTPAPSFPVLPRGFGSGNFLDPDYTFKKVQSRVATMTSLADFAVEADKQEARTTMTGESVRAKVRKERRERVLDERRELGIVMGDVFGVEAEKRISKKGKEIERDVAAVGVEEVEGGEVKEVEDGEVKEVKKAKKTRKRKNTKKPKDEEVNEVKKDGPWAEEEFDAHMGPDSNEPAKKLVLLPRGKTTLLQEDLESPKPLKAATPVTKFRKHPTRQLYIPEEEIIRRTQFLKDLTARNLELNQEIAVLGAKIETAKKAVYNEFDVVLARNEYVALLIKLWKKNGRTPLHNGTAKEFWDDINRRLKEHLAMDLEAKVKLAEIQVAIEMVTSMQEEIEDIVLLIQADRKALADAAYADANY